MYKLQGLRELYDGLCSNGQRQLLKELLLAYIRIYSPSSAFEICTTSQYLLEEEACVISTRYIAAKETIKNLCGRCLPLNEEEVKLLMAEGKDFSILYKTRYYPTSQLVGPLHLLNHSCQPNAKLEVMGERFSIKVVAIRPIAVGDEITICYGDNYFDERNRNCLCAHCKVVDNTAAERGNRKSAAPKEETTSMVARISITLGPSSYALISVVTRIFTVLDLRTEDIPSTTPYNISVLKKLRNLNIAEFLFSVRSLRGTKGWKECVFSNLPSLGVDFLPAGLCRNAQ